MKNKLLKGYLEEIEKRVEYFPNNTGFLEEIVQAVFWKKYDDEYSNNKEEIDKLKNQKISASDKSEIKEKIKHMIQTTNNDASVGGLIFVFGKISDKKDIPFLREQLEKYYKKMIAANGPFSQAYSILNTYGEAKINKGSWSFDDYDWNLKMAQKYLAEKPNSTVF